MMSDWRDQAELYRHLLWRRRWYVVIATLVVAAVTVPVVLNLPSLYQATTLIMVEPQKVPEEFVRATVTVPIQERLKTISQQVLSRTRLERVIDEFSLFQASTDSRTPQRLPVVHEWIDTVRRWVGYDGAPPAEGKPDKLSLVERMRANIAITVTGGSTFSITYTGQDPHTVQQVTNKLASLFIDENLKVREAQAEGTAEFLESELERVKSKLEAQETELRGFKQRYMGELPSQLDANLRTLDRLQAERNSVEGQLQSAEVGNEIMRQLELFDLNTNIGESTGRARPGESRLQALKARLAELGRTYKNDHPDMYLLKQEIAQLEKELESQRLQEPKSPKAPESTAQRSHTEDETSPALTALKQRRDEIKQEIRRYQERVDNTFLREQQLAIILRDYETISKTYQSLLDKRQNARIAENLERRQKGEMFRILDPAELPEKPFKPNRRLLVALGCLLGFGCGIGLAFLREQLDPSIRSEKDLVQATTGIPLLSVIPVVLAAEPTTRPRPGKPMTAPPPSIKARS